MEMGEAAAAGGARRLAGDRLHDPLDDALAGGGVHPGAVHGRAPRAAVPRVRRDHRRGDPGLGLRLADADADAVQPVPARRSTAQKHGRVLRRLRAASSTAMLRALRADAARASCATAASTIVIVAGRCSSARLICSTVHAQGIHPERGHGPDLRRHRGARRASRSRRWSQHQQAVADIVARDPERRGVHVEHRRAAAPSRRANTGRMFIRLKPRSRAQPQRRRGHPASCRPKLRAVPGHPRLPAEPAAHPHRRHARPRASTSSRLQGPDIEELYRGAPRCSRRSCATLPGLQDVTSDLQISNPQVAVEIDRDKAAALGVTRQQIESALYNAYGSRQVSTIYTPNNQYWVILELEPQYQRDPRRCSLLYVALRRGQARAARAPCAETRRPTSARSPSTTRPAPVGHALLQPASPASPSARPSRGRAGAAARDAALAPSPPAFQGTAQAFQSSLQGLGLLLIMADPRDLPGARHPVRELHPPADDPLGLPFAGFGALLTLLALPHRAEHLRLRRHHHAGRHRQEERHHDDRLRPRGRAQRGQIARARRSTRPASSASARS